jgi:hypothetical protein
MIEVFIVSRWDIFCFFTGENNGIVWCGLALFDLTGLNVVEPAL